MEAKRRALDEIGERQRAADEKRQQEAERQRERPITAESMIVQ
jgi:hypothetical protein